MKPIPVILDTDIGGDIDDTWALALLLRCPELDVKLITTDTGDTRFYRTKLVARMLDIADKADIPIGVGLPTADQRGSHSHAQGRWVEDYRMSDYPGTIHDDGVQAMIDTIMASDEQITLICIGPVPNMREALKRQPAIADRVRLVGMFGSIRRGHLGAPPIPETNVVVDIAAAQAAFTAGWDMTITPLDTCGIVSLDGEHYQRILDCRDPLIRAVIENYRLWEIGRGLESKVETASSILFDTVAVYLAFADDLLVMEDLGVRVDDQGYTRTDPSARVVHCATEWRDYSAFQDWLVGRLVSASCTGRTRPGQR